MRRSRFLVQWGNMRHRELSLGWIMVALVVVQVLLDEKCAVVEALPVEVEGELSELAGNHEGRRDEIESGVAMRLMQMQAAAAERAGDDIEPGEEREQRPREPKELTIPKIEAVKLLLHQYKQIEEEAERAEIEDELERSASDTVVGPVVGSGRTESARAIWSEDFERRAAELCGTKASLDCGKRVLSLIDGQASELSVHMKCDLRDDFLKCIDTEKRSCLEMTRSSMLPDLPPKDVIKVEQSKLWKVLWTAGGCVLAN